ncbi:zinc finger protein 414 [Ranitomeya variabilis]|uniref:zinc finger protein 414 n=1 Tax=Ranitomeya variabilis TaxID=490064 RepID=UPI00405760AE
MAALVCSVVHTRTYVMAAKLLLSEAISKQLCIHSHSSQSVHPPPMRAAASFPPPSIISRYHCTQNGYNVTQRREESSAGYITTCEAASARAMEKTEEPSAEAQATDTVPSTPQSVRGVKVETKRPGERGRKRGVLPSKKGHKCSTYGCNRTFLNMQDLIHHVSIHYKPTQSMQDKKFFCSISGCGAILHSMQELMSHLKVHYKPNRYFKCENCMQHFRTHRSLFKHLHVCSDNAARSVSQSTTSLPASSDSDSATPAGPVSRQTSVIQCIKKDNPLPVANDIPTTSMAAVASTSTLPGGHLASMSKLASKASNSFSAFDPNLFGGRVSGTSQISAASSYLSYMNPSAYNSPQASMSKLKPFLGNQSLPASNATWKKNQGHTTNSRIIWEHTRDNYRCMQCNFSTATRDQMDKHIELFHKNPTSARLDEIDYDVDLLSFHSKLPAEMESDLLP